MSPRMLVAAVAGSVALGAAIAPSIAGAQEDGGATISVEQTHPASTSVHYIVQVTDADGEPADGATVTATATGPDGTAGSPVNLTGAGDGQYQGTVELSESGTWSVQFQSTSPDATLDHTQEMPAEAQSGGGADSDDDGGSAIVLVLAAVFLAVVAAIAAWIWFTRQREPVDEGDPVGPPPEQP